MPFKTLDAAIPLAQEIANCVVFTPVVVGLAVTFTEQLPLAETVVQPLAPDKVKLVVSPIDTVQEFAVLAPPLAMVTAVGAELPPTVTDPK